MSSPSKSYRDEFILPDNRSVGAIKVATERQGEPDFILVAHDNVAQYESTSDSACVYLCGNSLGACPKQSQVLIQEELDVWGNR